jgi:ATP-binding cassette, subfamily B, bacterial PglK
LGDCKNGAGRTIGFAAFTIPIPFTKFIFQLTDGILKDADQNTPMSFFNDVKALWLHINDKRRRRSALILLASMFAGMVLEMAGVGTIFSAITILLGNSAGSAAVAMRSTLSNFLGVEQSQLVAVMMMVLALLFTLKVLFQIYVVKCVTTFGYNLQADLSRELYRTYLNQPYEYHLLRNSEQLINTVDNEGRDAATAISTALSLLADFLVAVGLGVVLVLVSPAIGLAIAAIAVAAGVMMIRHNRVRLAKWAHLARDHQAQKMKSLRQGFDGYKEVQLRGAVDTAVADYDVSNRANTNAARHFAALSAYPRLWMEWLSVVGLAIVVLVIDFGASASTSVLPLLGLVGALSPSGFCRPSAESLVVCKCFDIIPPPSITSPRNSMLELFRGQKSPLEKFHLRRKSPSTRSAILIPTATIP